MNFNTNIFIYLSCGAHTQYTLHIFELLTNQQQQQQMAYEKRNKKTHMIYVWKYVNARH